MKDGDDEDEDDKEDDFTAPVPLKSCGSLTRSKANGNRVSSLDGVVAHG